MRSLAVLSFVASLAGSSMISATAQETPAFDRFAWSVRREQVAFAAANLLVLNSRSALRAEEMAGTLQLKPVAEVAFPFPQSAFRGRTTVGASSRRSQFLPASIR